MAVRKIHLMHSKFGRCESHICGECSNFISGRYHNRYLRKCTVYGATHSEASDWAKSWTACGMFNKEYKGTPIIKFVRPEGQRANTPIEGQIKFEV